LSPGQPNNILISVIGVAGVVATLVISLFALHQVKPPSDSVLLEIASGEYSGDGSADWNNVALPHDWHRERLVRSQLWYRFEFNLSAVESELHALYLPVISQNAAVFLNGVEVGNGGSVEEPVARNWPRPLMLPIAEDILLTGKNELILQVLSDPAGRGLLPVFYLGKWVSLLPSYNFRKMLKQTALGAAVVILITVAMFLFFITWRRKESSEYAWGAATFLSLSGHSLPVFFQHTPVKPYLWEWWQHLCMGSTIFFMLIFVNRYFSLRKTRLEICCAVILTGAALLSLFLAASGKYQAAYYNHAGGIWGLCSLMMGTIPLTVTMTNAVGRKDISALYMLCVGTVMFILGVHDMLFVNGFLTRENGYLIHYASPLVALLLTAILISRLIQTSDTLEDLNRSLEDRIEQNSRELAATYERVQEMERQQLLTAERERFGRDMHDGLGGHLSTALALAESRLGANAPLTNTIRDATDEMRLMLDTASAMDEDIGMVIGSLRARLQSQADIVGFELLWQIEDTSPINKLGPGAAMSLIRIVQESVNNAIKHSGGDVIRVSVYDHENAVHLEIADNGRCVTLEREHGNGVRNIGKRAEELGASVSFDPESELGGLAVCVEIPSLTCS
jgi:signal transduction histidine kinase